MDQTNPRRGRFLKIFLILLLIAGGAAGAGWFYLDAANSGEPQTTEQTAEAPEGSSESASGEKDESEESGSADADASDDGEAADADGEKDGEKDGDKDGDGKEGEKKEDPAIPVNVAEVRTGTVSAYITATANLVAENEVKILAEAEGRVQSLLVEEGDPVSRDAMLASLVNDSEEIALQKAQVREGTARTAFERAERMATQKLISPEDFDNTTRDHKVAVQELEEARWKLARTEIRSPFAGRVTQRMVTLGKHVRPGDELFTITDFDPLVARIFLPEKDVVGLSEQRDVRISLKADESVQFDGRIRQISPVVDTATGTVKVTVEAVNPPRQVRPGGFVTVDIIKETRPDVVVLPREAVIRELQRAHVFVIGEEEKAVKRAVKLGLEEGERVEILEGVRAGEQVIVAGQGSLKDGSKVKVIPVATAEHSSEEKKPPRQARG